MAVIVCPTVISVNSTGASGGGVGAGAGAEVPPDGEVGLLNTRLEASQPKVNTQTAKATSAPWNLDIVPSVFKRSFSLV